MYYQKYQHNSFSLVMMSDGEYLNHLFFDNDDCSLELYEEKNLDIFDETKKWLDNYFLGNKSQNTLKIMLKGTNFQKEVWDILLTIPYGHVMTYGEIASIMALKKGIKKMSAQAIGQAVSQNPIAIIVPCHRVIGKNNKLTGYRWGNEIKEKLLRLEGIL